MSVNGAEEDGVENRVEAPSRASGDEPGSATPGDSSDRVITQDSTSAAEAVVPTNGASQSLNGPAPAWQAGTSEPPPLMSPSGPAITTTSPMTAVAGAASSARSLAAKVGASFSSVTKNASKPKAPPRRPSAPIRRPGGPGAGLPPRAPQGSRTHQGGSQTRRALLSLERVEPLSVMKFSFLISLVGWVVLFVAVAVVYFALSKLGVFTKIETTVGLVTYNKTHPGTNAASWFRASRVLEYTALVCTINAILFTALATVGAALYNLVATLTGGIEVTLKESD